MSHNHCLAAVLAALSVALASPSMAEDAAAPKISDFLADTGATYVGAAGIISLDDKLVTNVSSPRDFVFAIGQGRADGQSNGFGVAFAPGRAKFETFAVDIRKYGDADARDFFSMEEFGKRWRRLLNSATISYAQNTRTMDSVDYRQRAAALHLEYFFHYDDDPTVAAYRTIMGLAKPGPEAGACSSLAALRGAARSPTPEFAERNSAVVASLAPKDARPKDPQPPVPNLVQESRNAAAEVKKERARSGAAAAAPSRAASAPSSEITAEDLQKLVQDCADEALTASRAKWNATKFTLLVGKGDLRGPNAADPRLSLGQHVQLGFQIGPDAWENTLFTFTARHTARGLNLDSVGTTPTYHSGMLWAARGTYGVTSDRGMYGIAEVSDARSKNAGVASGAFKWAVGFDKKLADSMWVEIRYGKAVLRSGESSETKLMANAKFAFDSELSGLVKK